HCLATICVSLVVTSAASHRLLRLASSSGLTGFIVKYTPGAPPVYFSAYLAISFRWFESKYPDSVCGRRYDDVATLGTLSSTTLPGAISTDNARCASAINHS